MTIRIPSFRRVSDLKQAINDHVQIRSPPKFGLRFDGRVLDNEKLLSECGLENRDIVEVILTQLR